MQTHPRPGLHRAAGLQGAVHADQGGAGHVPIVGQVGGLAGVQVHRVGGGVGRVQAAPSPGGRAVPQGADLEAVTGADVRRRIAGLIVPLRQIPDLVRRPAIAVAWAFGRVVEEGRVDLGPVLRRRPMRRVAPVVVHDPSPRVEAVVYGRGQDGGVFRGVLARNRGGARDWAREIGGIRAILPHRGRGTMRKHGGGGYSSPIGGGGPCAAWWRGLRPRWRGLWVRWVGDGTRLSAIQSAASPLHRCAVPLPRWGRIFGGIPPPLRGPVVGSHATLLHPLRGRI